jgi:hypothetical protein
VGHNGRGRRPCRPHRLAHLGAEVAGAYRRLSDGAQLGMTAGAAAVFYVTPSFYVYAAALVVLFLLIYFRPAWGVALIAFCIPFYVPPAQSRSSNTASPRWKSSPW